MTFYAHLNLLSAVIMGLAVVKLLQGIGWMIHGRQRIKVYWVHLVWVALAIFTQFVHYWALGNLRNNMHGESWRGFADMLLAPIFAYLVAVLLFPPPGEDRPVVLRDFYYENHAWIFGAYAGVALVNAGFLGDLVNQPLELETILGRYPPRAPARRFGGYPQQVVSHGDGDLSVARDAFCHICHTQLSVGDER